VGEGRLALQALRVLPDGDQQGGGGVDAPAVDGDQGRGCLGHEPREVAVEPADLLGKSPVAAGDGTQRELGGRRDVVRKIPGAEALSRLLGTP
jgi:hypothetical protein